MDVNQRDCGRASCYGETILSNRVSRILTTEMISKTSSVWILNWRIEHVPMSKSAKGSERHISLNSLMSGLWDNLHKFSVWKWGVKIYESLVCLPVCKYKYASIPRYNQRSCKVCTKSQLAVSPSNFPFTQKSEPVCRVWPQLVSRIKL